MAKNDTESQVAELRKRAETMIGTPEESSKFSGEHQDTEEIRHELRVYQAELEIQNEQLREALEVLEESRNRYADLYDFAPIGYLTLDQRGHILNINITGAAMLGQERGPLLGKPFAAWLAEGQTRGAFFPYLSKVLSSGDRVTTELLLSSKAKTTFWVRLESVVTGEFGQCLTVMIDITKRKLAEEALAQRTHDLEQANQELEQFSYIASHDLKAPLRAVSNLSIWLEEDLADRLSEEEHRMMALLGERVQRMDALINALLEYSRAGRAALKTELVDTGALLRKTIEHLCLPQRFTVEAATDMPHIETDQMCLGRVFANLICNAIQHHEREDGRVEVSIEDNGGFYEFTVADDGPGIAAENRDKVFDIFQTLKSKDRGGGTGIGLALVKKLVESQGGTITLDTRPGPGATFRFTLPKRLAVPRTSGD